MHAAIPQKARDTLPLEILARLRPGDGIDRQLGLVLRSLLRDGLDDCDLEKANFSMNNDEDQRIKEAIRGFMHSWIESRFQQAITTVEIACGIDP